MRVARQVWARVEKENVKDNVVDSLDSERVKTSLTAARASQRQDKAGLVTVDEESLPQVHAYASCTKKDIDDWLKTIKITLPPTNLANLAFFFNVNDFALNYQINFQVARQQTEKKLWAYEAARNCTAR